MAMQEVLLLAGLILGAAILYSSVGHAGASGYLAAMALFGLASEVMKPTALSLNILVAAIATAQFYRAGHFSWSLFFPFTFGSIPLAFIGGAIQVPEAVYKPAVGLVLLFAAGRLFLAARSPAAPLAEGISMPPLAVAVGLGGVIGFLSGLIGVGGGIFLSPLLLLMKWADIRHTAAVSAAFILVNSIAGLAGNLTSVRFLPESIPIWAVAAAVGGVIGSELGSRRFPSPALRSLLAVVLVIAAVKLIFS
jgi:uncharacterized membrane protein YfcA